MLLMGSTVGCTLSKKESELEDSSIGIPLTELQSKERMEIPTHP
jgi:hypothetical protein